VALILGFGAGVVLGIVTLIAALAAVVVRARGHRRPQPEAVRSHPALRPRRIACDLLALGALSAGAVVLGNHLGDAQLADPAVEVPLSAALWWWLLLAAVLLVLGRIPLPSGSKMDVIR
jgi:heme/copper-type cytochrome/quinol oxidase subunit 2